MLQFWVKNVYANVQFNLIVLSCLNENLRQNYPPTFYLDTFGQVISIATH